ncbi:MAG: hypothetical protein KVP17_003411, partial [Porospora cf. gigantea B]|uniref:uncharacterized protein n=1 Tax=Porospora cf. gigantea B TaxID=2853592 RepID=UPI003571F0A8
VKPDVVETTVDEGNQKSAVESTSSVEAEDKVHAEETVKPDVAETTVDEGNQKSTVESTSCVESEGKVHAEETVKPDVVETTVDEGKQKSTVESTSCVEAEDKVHAEETVKPDVMETTVDEGNQKSTVESTICVESEDKVERSQVEAVGMHKVLEKRASAAGSDILTQDSAPEIVPAKIPNRGQPTLKEPAAEFYEVAVKLTRMVRDRATYRNSGRQDDLTQYAMESVRRLYRLAGFDSHPKACNALMEAFVCGGGMHALMCVAAECAASLDNDVSLEFLEDVVIFFRELLIVLTAGVSDDSLQQVHEQRVVHSYCE